MKRFISVSFFTACCLLFTAYSAHAAYEAITVSDGGSIKGKVTFKGPLPNDAVEKIIINKNPEVCNQDIYSKDGYREVRWIDVKGNALRGVFVFIDGITKGKAWPTPEGGKYMIEQKNCRFQKWAQVVQRGPITIRHSDPPTVLHNINTREKIGVESGSEVMKTIFNFAQPDPGDIEKELKPRRSPFIAINCEAHNFMFAFMMAPEHPYTEVVDDDGAFTIKDVPPGSYTVKAWHPRFGLKEGKVNISAKGSAEVNFEFSK